MKKKTENCWHNGPNCTNSWLYGYYKKIYRGNNKLNKNAINSLRLRMEYFVTPRIVFQGIGENFFLLIIL